MAKDRPPRLPSGEVEREVVKYLKSELPRTVPTNEIVRTVSHRVDCHPGTVRKALCRLVDRDPPPVLRVERGWYRAWMDPEDLAKVERPLPHLHAIQLRLVSPQNRGQAPRGGQTTFNDSRPGPEYETSSKQWQDRWVWRGRKVTVQLSTTTGTVLVSLRSSSDPLEPQEFAEFTERLAGWCQAQGIWWDDRLAEVVTLDLNMDYTELSVSEFRSAKLKVFKEAWVQVYQKSERLMRMELRVAPKGGMTAGELGQFMESLVRLTHQPVDEEPDRAEEPDPPRAEDPPLDPWDPSIV